MVENFSIKDMFLHADLVVQAVMVILFLVSLLSWIVIFEKCFLLHGSRRHIRAALQQAENLTETIDPDHFRGQMKALVDTGLSESRDHAGNESRADFRERVERSMRAALAMQFERIGNRTVILATVGSLSPFIGLFGTVWGIMHSFMGIAESGETSLAVVAPGIAEALFATAMGLIAAIPATIFYNKFTSEVNRQAQRLEGFADEFSAILSRQMDERA